MEYSLTDKSEMTQVCTCEHHEVLHESREYRGDKSRTCCAVRDGERCPCRRYVAAPVVRQFDSLEALFAFVKQQGEIDGWILRVHHL